MLAVKTDLAAADLPENLNRLRAQIERDVPVGVNFHTQPLAPAGSREALTLGIAWRSSKGVSPNAHPGRDGRFDEPRMWRQLGSLGGGNHFVNLPRFRRRGVDHAALGSRNVGNTIGQRAMHMAKKVAERVDRSCRIATLRGLTRGRRNSRRTWKGSVGRRSTRRSTAI